MSPGILIYSTFVASFIFAGSCKRVRSMGSENIGISASNTDDGEADESETHDESSKEAKSSEEESKVSDLSAAMLPAKHGIITFINNN